MESEAGRTHTSVAAAPDGKGESSMGPLNGSKTKKAEGGNGNGRGATYGDEEDVQSLVRPVRSVGSTGYAGSAHEIPLHELESRRGAPGAGDGVGSGSGSKGGGYKDEAQPVTDAGNDGAVERVASGGQAAASAAGPAYKVYKRRWFGLVQLTLLNIVVSWDWLTFAPVADTAASFFSVSVSAINWLSTAFFFAFVAASPAVIVTLHRGPKPSIITSASLLLVGNWVRYAGTRAGSNGYFGVVMFGQILTGLAQPFVLSAPTRYSDLWFTNRGRVAATAVTTLANPLGAALGQLIVPFWVEKESDLPNMVLYVSILSSVSCLPAFFIPARPPTTASASGTTAKLPLRTSLRVLFSSLEVWLIIVAFMTYVGFFNSVSSLLSQIFTPYGFTDDDAGIGGGLLIVVGLVSAAITSPLLDRTKRFLPVIKTCVPIIAACYLVLIWMPGTRSLAGPYVVLSILGAASFSLLPVALETLIEVSHPVGPEVTSTVAWAGGQLLGGCFLLIQDALKAGDDADPPKNMTRALIFSAIVAIAVAPLPMALGLFGRADKVRLRRVMSDQQGSAA